MNMLFALDAVKQEVIVSESPKGGNKINFIERVGRKEDEVLYNAVVTLTSITDSPHLDVAIFKAADKLCQLIYSKYKESN